MNIVRLKNKSFKEQIDCTDLTFIEKDPIDGTMIQTNHNNKNYYVLYDSFLYAHAFNNDRTELKSEASVNLKDTPFIMDQAKQTFAIFGE